MTTSYPSAGPPRRGRGLTIAGAVMIVVAIVGGIIGFAVLVNTVDISALERDVAVSGAPDRLVPGEIEFSVLEPLGGGDGSMSVGVVLSDAVTVPCTLHETPADGEGLGDEIRMTAPRSGEEFLDLSYETWRLTSVARLDPGDYVVSCGAEGEPSADAGSFAVGRVLSVDDVRGWIAPMLWTFGIWGLSALVFVVGVVLLIVGLVQRSRSRREAAYGGGYGGGPYGGGYGGGGYPGPNPPGSWQQGGPQQGGPQQGGPQQGDPQQGGWPAPPPPQIPPPGQHVPPPHPGQAPPQPGRYDQPGPYDQPGQYEPPSPFAPPSSPSPEQRSPFEPPTEVYPQPPAAPPAAPPTGPPSSPPGDDGGSGWTIPPSKKR